MKDNKTIESLNRVREQIAEESRIEGLTKKLKLLKMIEELILEQVANENSRRTISQAR